MIGGGLRYDNSLIFGKIIELAGGKGAKISIIPSASAKPELYGSLSVDAFNKYGANAELIPIWNCDAMSNYETASNDKGLVEKVSTSSGVYFIGGFQDKLVQSLMKSTNKKSKVLNAIWKVYNKGGVIAGTSAGASVMGKIMFKYGESMDVMINHNKINNFLHKGLGFIGKDVFIDQHFIERGRLGRMLVAMKSKRYMLGIGIAEDTTIIVKDDWIDVIGYKGALIVDLSKAHFDEKVKEFNLKNIVLSYISNGDSFNLETKEVKISNHKLNGIKIDPNASDFNPYNKTDKFYPDIFANSVIVDLMSNLIDNEQKKAIGLAFLMGKGFQNIQFGFEFKFRKSVKSIGYYSGILGSEDYTVLNIHLDVTPIGYSKFFTLQK